MANKSSEKGKLQEERFISEDIVPRLSGESRDDYVTRANNEIEKKLEARKKRVVYQGLPSNTLTTSNINLSTPGTSGVDITVSNNPDINVSVNAEAKKGKTKDPDPYNWYIKKRLKY